jgi:hypothetical protein
MERKGRVLKVRLGYNANSSSLASVVNLLLFGSGVAVAVISTVAAALFSGKAEPPPATRSPGDQR